MGGRRERERSTLKLRHYIAATWVLLIACSRPAPEPATAGVVSAPSPPSIFITGCEAAKPFSGFRTEIFLADDTQLQELFNCRYLGLTREKEGAPPPGDCSLHEHSSQVVTLPVFSATTMQHLGHVLKAPVVDRGPSIPDNADWPPLTLNYVGATTAPDGTLWVVPPAYLHLLRDLPGSQSPQGAGAALAAHLLELSPALRNAEQPGVACTRLVSRLVDLATLAITQRRQLYVLSRLDKNPSQPPSP
jgi:hypothetical protein